MVTCQSSELGWKVTVELPTDFLSLGRGLSLCTVHYALCTVHYSYIFIRIHTYLLFYTYSYVFTISRENPTKSRDFGTHA